MHLPDAILSGPVAAATAVVGAAGLVVCARRMRQSPDPRVPLMTGMAAAFVFAAQMVNFRIMAGASGHLIGGVLALMGAVASLRLRWGTPPSVAAEPGEASKAPRLP